MNATPTIETSIEPHAPHWVSRAAFPVLVDAVLPHAGVAGLRRVSRELLARRAAGPDRPAISCTGMLIGFHEASHGLLRKNRLLQ